MHKLGLARIGTGLHVFNGYLLIRVSVDKPCVKLFLISKGIRVTVPNEADNVLVFIDGRQGDLVGAGLGALVTGDTLGVVVTGDTLGAMVIGDMLGANVLVVGVVLGADVVALGAEVTY